MANQILKLIPAFIGLIPDNIDMSQIKLTLNEMNITYDVIKFDITPNLAYIDCGDTPLTVRCNVCRADADDWWAEYLLYSRDQQYKRRHFITPCCQSETDLESLLYSADIGFSKFVVEIKNPSSILTAEELTQLSKIFETEMKMIISNNA